MNQSRVGVFFPDFQVRQQKTYEARKAAVLRSTFPTDTTFKNNIQKSMISCYGRTGYIHVLLLSDTEHVTLLFFLFFFLLLKIPFFSSANCSITIKLAL